MLFARVWLILGSFIFSNPVLAQETGEASLNPGEGSLSVTSSVSGAQVFVDYDLAGEVPHTQALSSGAHNVRVTADNFDPYVMRVTIVAGEIAEIHAELLEGGGTVEFFVDPQGAAVEMDGRSVGSTPIRVTDLQEGEHRWNVSAPNHETHEGRFQFRAGQNVLIVGELESSTGLFEVTSRPSGAQVFLDGELVGDTPLQLEDVEPGLHRLRVSAEGRGSVLREIDTTDGAKGELYALLPSRACRVVVKTGNPEARVYVDEQLVGQDKTVDIHLARGAYEISVDAPGLKRASLRVRVPDAGVRAFRAELVPEAARADSQLVRSKSLAFFNTWQFWTAVGSVGGAGVIGTVMVLNQPEPVVQVAGDVAVVLP